MKPLQPAMLPPEQRCLFFTLYGLSRRSMRSHDEAALAASKYVSRAWRQFNLHLSVMGTLLATDGETLHTEGRALWNASLGKVGHHVSSK